MGHREFFEILSWAQLGIHDKPCGLLNVGGYYQHLIRFLDYRWRRAFSTQSIVRC
jgi:predicted Rossmann-fold nucleotide-binding protein